jgi:hypothetical protein
VQKPGDAWPDEVVARHFEFYASLAFKNCAKACRLFRAENPGWDKYPDENTVRSWAQFYAWEAMVDGDLERTQGRRLHTLRQQWFGLMEQAADNIALAGAGAFDDNPQAGVVRIQAAKIAMEPIVRGVIPLSPPTSSEGAGIDYDKLTPEEKQALARQIMQERKGKGDGG